MKKTHTLDRKIAKHLRSAVRAAEDTKATGLIVLDLRGITSMTDFFMICSGSSERQVQAIGDHIVERLKEDDRRPLSIEGHLRGQWVLLDYGDFVVHLFLDETRRFYRLENLWGDAAEVSAEYRGAAVKE